MENRDCIVKTTLKSYVLSDREITQNAIEWCFVNYEKPTINDVVARVFDVVAKHRLHSKLKPNSKSSSTRETKSSLLNPWKGARKLVHNGMRNLKKLYSIDKDGYIVKVSTDDKCSHYQKNYREIMLKILSSGDILERGKFEPLFYKEVTETDAYRAFLNENTGKDIGQEKAILEGKKYLLTRTLTRIKDKVIKYGSRRNWDRIQLKLVV